jgi:predicted HAD superfamily Cof-like phosphohydrolase
MSNYVADAVETFLRAMDAKQDADLRATLIREEAQEVIEAFAALLKELADLAYVLEGFNQLEETEELQANITMLNGNDTVQIALSVATKLARILPPDVTKDAFLRVHLSNMSKLGPDGKPIRRPSDGKVLKGPNYKPPVLEDLVGKI